MSDERYVAYVGTYTKKNSKGIHLLDFDAKRNTFAERKEIPADNPSFVLPSSDGRCLYATSNQGVIAYRILPDGDLEFINAQATGGMRGCYLETDPEGRFLFVGGYYDGRVSVLRLNDDGSIGEIADGVFHEGANMDETGCSYMSHVTCVKLTPDKKGLFAVDNGLDQVMAYAFDAETGKLTSRGVLRCELDSAPRLICTDRQGKFIYVLCEQTNHVCVYRTPKEEIKERQETLLPIQKISTIAKESDRKPSTFGMDFSPDGKHLFVSNAVTNTAVVYDVDGETGELAYRCSASLSGEYPKYLMALPDNEHFAVLGLNTGTLTVYRVNYEAQYLLMSAKPVLIDQPNAICLHKLI